MVPQAIPKAFTVAGELVTGRCRYMGHVIIASADAAASFTIWDGPALNARPVDVCNFTTIGISRQWYGPQGILCEAGITIGTVTGAATGIVYYTPQAMLGGLVLIDESGSQRVIVDMNNQVDIDAVWAKLNEEGY